MADQEPSESVQKIRKLGRKSQSLRKQYYAEEGLPTNDQMRRLKKIRKMDEEAVSIRQRWDDEEEFGGSFIKFFNPMFYIRKAAQATAPKSNEDEG